MEKLLAAWSLQGIKPVLASLALPPVPFLLAMLLGAMRLSSRRRGGWPLVFFATASIWLSACAGVGDLVWRALDVPPALSTAARVELRERVMARRPVAIVVLGAGRESQAPEYGAPNLTALAVERLRYGSWLARETGTPLVFSGGQGWADAAGGATEADIARSIAQRDFGMSLRWIEQDSRDTRENAERTVALLRRNGIGELVLVSHGWHLPRAKRLFTAADPEMHLILAPVGLAPRVERPLLRWMPTVEGFAQVRLALREAIALLATRP